MKKSKALKDILDHINTMELLMVATSSAYELMNDKYEPATDILVQKMVHKINGIATNNEIALIVKIKCEDDLQDARKKYREVFESITRKKESTDSLVSTKETVSDTLKQMREVEELSHGDKVTDNANQYIR